MMWLFLACISKEEPSEPVSSEVSGAIEMNMVVSSAINGEYEPCG